MYALLIQRKDKAKFLEVMTNCWISEGGAVIKIYIVLYVLNDLPTPENDLLARVHTVWKDTHM